MLVYLGWVVQGTQITGQFAEWQFVLRVPGAQACLVFPYLVVFLCVCVCLFVFVRVGLLVWVGLGVM